MRPTTETADTYILRRCIFISSLFSWLNPCRFGQQIRSIMRQILGIPASVPEVLACHRTELSPFIFQAGVDNCHQVAPNCRQDLGGFGSHRLRFPDHELYRLTPVISLTSQKPDPAFYVIEFLDPTSPIMVGILVHFQMREEN